MPLEYRPPVSHPPVETLHVEPLHLLELAQPALSELYRHPEYGFPGGVGVESLPGRGTEQLDSTESPTISHGGRHLGQAPGGTVAVSTAALPLPHHRLVEHGAHQANLLPIEGKEGLLVTT